VVEAKVPLLLTFMGIWKGVAMDSLKYHPGLNCPTLLRSVGRPPQKWPYGHTALQSYGLMAVWGVAHLQGGRPSAVFYPLGHPTPYAYADATDAAVVATHTNGKKLFPI
jgi:hypothetical protein